MKKNTLLLRIQEHAILGLEYTRRHNKIIVECAWHDAIDHFSRQSSECKIAQACIDQSQVLTHTQTVQDVLSHRECMQLMQTHTHDWFGHVTSDLYMDYVQMDETLHVAAAKREKINTLLHYFHARNILLDCLDVDTFCVARLLKKYSVQPDTLATLITELFSTEKIVNNTTLLANDFLPWAALLEFLPSEARSGDRAPKSHLKKTINLLPTQLHQHKKNIRKHIKIFSIYFTATMILIFIVNQWMQHHQKLNSQTINNLQKKIAATPLNLLSQKIILLQKLKIQNQKRNSAIHNNQFLVSTIAALTDHLPAQLTLLTMNFNKNKITVTGWGENLLDINQYQQTMMQLHRFKNFHFTQVQHQHNRYVFSLEVLL